MKSLSAAPPIPAAKPDLGARKLVVGREIVVSGEIASCEALVVEGTVRASVDCKDLQIAASGLFTGKATVAHAEIFGRFEGELTVTERLMVRASGKISAKLRYNEIEVERGARISGDIEWQHSAKAEPATTATATPLRA
jgi:cytoskeletal protein CcmA (bactofilin family)